MAIDFSFINRVPLHPGRVTLNPVAGESGKYDMARSDEPLEEGTPLNANTFNNLVNLINADIERAKNEAVSAGLKCATGTYAGTGTYGYSNKNALDFGFKPLFVFIARKAGGGAENTTASKFNMAYAHMLAINGQSNVQVNSSWHTTTTDGFNYDTFSAILTWSSTGITWYSSSNQGSQLNQASTQYVYFAIG